MKVKFNRGALADIEEITAYIGDRNPKAAASLLARFDAAAKLIGRMPVIGMRAGRGDLRKLVVGNYLIIYEVAIAEIVIHYVRHGARRRPWEGET